MGAGTIFNPNEQLSCAVPTIRIECETHYRWWARRTRGPPSLTCYASAFAHPYDQFPLSQGRMETATMKINSRLFCHIDQRAIRISQMERPERAFGQGLEPR